MGQIALVGKPNSGKSSLFNLLTGLYQKVGNYSGVTVERKTGKFLGNEIIDLPGIRSLWISSPEEKISLDAILDYHSKSLPILFVANGTELEDALSLFTEMADLQTNMAIIINFKDELEKNKIEVDAENLKAKLGCPVILMNSKSGEGLSEIIQLVEENNFNVPHSFCRSRYDQLENGELKNNFKSQLIQSGTEVTDAAYKEINDDFVQRQRITRNIVQACVTKNQDYNSLLNRSQKIDRFMLHPILGLLSFFFVLLLLFQAVFTLSAYPMDWIDAGFGMASEWAQNNIGIPWLADLVSQGILPGIGGVLIFIPQIAILFLLLGLLEQSGYLSRISFISDRVLQKFGLSGKSIIPLMSSWACAIPAIMSTRVINDPKERMAVIMAAPLMTCAARLPVYTILIAVMFPDAEGGLFDIRGISLFILYFIGVLATLLVALFANKRMKGKSNAMWTLDLPIYRVPNWRNIFTSVYLKTKAFVIEAGKIIFMISIVLWLLASFSPKNEQFIDTKYQEYLQENPAGDGIEQANKESFALEYSYAGYLGKIIEPVIKPLGYDWKIGIALITSFAAREVFVGTLSTIYSIGSEEESSIVARLQNETNLDTGQKRFNLATSISLLLFYVFALQCMSTIAIVKKETGSWKFALAQFVLMFVLAYFFGFVSYQLLS